MICSTGTWKNLQRRSMVSSVTLQPGALIILDRVARCIPVASEISLIVTRLPSSKDFFSISVIKWYLNIFPPRLPSFNHNWFFHKKSTCCTEQSYKMRTIISDSAGNLVLRLKVLGQRFSEQTQFNDSPQNRAYLRNTLKKIDEEIKCRCARAKRAGGGRLR